MYNYFPYQPNGLLKVNGSEGARLYPMQPNSVVALFDANEDIFYVKSSDSGGFSTVTAYSFKRMEEEKKEPAPDYVTHKELEELKETLKGMIENGKQLIPTKSRKQPDADASAI